VQVYSKHWLVGGTLVSWGIFTTSVPVKANSVPPDDSMAQVTSVNQLANLQPTDWDFQTLRLLVERYGAISGYPDTTQGNSSTRSEFASVLNQVLEQINTLIANGAGSQINREDVITLRRLQKQYGSAWDDLSTRLNSIGDRTTELAADQFSTTTQLQGEVILAFTEGGNANPTVVSRQRLNLVTSFTPVNQLLTQLESGNALGGEAIAKAHNEEQNLLGTTGVIADGGGLEYAEVSNSVLLRRLYYTFRPRSNLAVTIGAKISTGDFIDRNRYANDEAVDFSSSFFINTPLIVQNQIDRDGRAGAAITWNIDGEPLTVRSLYIASDANQPSSTTGGGGMFDNQYQGSVELEYLLSNQLAVRLQYTNASIKNTGITAAGLSAEYAFNRNSAIFGRFGFGSYQGFSTAIERELDLQLRTWAISLALRNFAMPGTLAGIAIGQPFVEDDLGNATQTNFEAFSNFQLSDNISITPAF